MFPKLTRSDNKRNILLTFWLTSQTRINRWPVAANWTKTLSLNHKTGVFFHTTTRLSEDWAKPGKTFRQTIRDFQRCCALKCVLILLIFDRNWQHDICLALLHKMHKGVGSRSRFAFLLWLDFHTWLHVSLARPTLPEKWRTTPGRKIYFFIVRLLGEK